MQVNNQNYIERCGLVAGFLLPYLVFTTILYFALHLNRMDSRWTYLYALCITATIVVAGKIIRKVLK